MSGRRVALALAVVALAAGCSDGARVSTGEALQRAPLTTASTAERTTTTKGTTTTASPPTTTTTTKARAAAPTSTTRPHPPRVVRPQRWVPYATVGPVVLHHPSDHTEAIGFHQSAQDGAQSQTPGRSTVRWFVMESRDRDTTARGAADIVVEPDRQVRAPVTGTVIRAGTYTLYCDHVDQFVVIEPDARPGWEVKMLHIDGLALSVGERVEAGITPVATRARVLPFPSQVEDDTGLPAWPHVHVEVVDPTVPDRPTGPGCS